MNILPFHSFSMRVAILFTITFLLGVFSAQATHLVGGEMTYEYLGNDEYRITLMVYRDCSPDNTNETGFDDDAAIGIFENGALFTSVSVPIDTESVAELPTPDDDPCIIVPTSVCIERALYVVNVVLPPSEFGYSLAYQRCCRTPAIINLVLPEDTGNTILTNVPASTLVNGTNSSPVFGSLPPVLLCANFPFQMDHSADESDGDSLNYKFCNPFHGASPYNPVADPPEGPPYTNVTWELGFNWDDPIASAMPFTINPVTGLLEGTPTQPGKYAVGICVEEYRNGVFIASIIRDFMYNVVECVPVALAVIEPQPDPCSGTFVQFFNNSINAETVFWDFGVAELDSDTSDILEPSYDFPGPGEFVVTLIVNEGDVCEDETTATFATWPPLVPATTIPPPFCAGGGMAIDPLGGGTFQNGDQFGWTFDGPASMEESDLLDPGIVVYSEPGEYEITFQIFNDNCLEIITEMIVIPQFPVAAIQEQNAPCSGLTFDFINESFNTSNYWWDFGLPGWDDTSNEENPSYTYEDYGIYNVLLVAGPESDCADTAFVQISVTPENPVVFAYNFETGDPCDSIPLTIGQYIGSEVDFVQWNMGDGTIYETNDVEHFYDSQGFYTVQLEIHYDLCDIIEMAEIDIYYQTAILGDLIRMPNVISPNQDHLNERFRPFILGESQGFLPDGRDVYDYISNYHLQIFNRWGIELFSSDAGILWWDGTISGEVAKEGTYYYMVQYQEQCSNEMTQFSGSFEVLVK